MTYPFSIKILVCQWSIKIRMCPVLLFCNIFWRTCSLVSPGVERRSSHAQLIVVEYILSVRVMSCLPACDIHHLVLDRSILSLSFNLQTLVILCILRRIQENFCKIADGIWEDCTYMYLLKSTRDTGLSTGRLLQNFLAIIEFYGGD